MRQMIGKLERKQRKQIKAMESLQSEHDKFVAAKLRNREMKAELTEMKDLMKELLLEREELRMFSFYQDE